MIRIQQARSEGDSDYALKQCVQLVDWLPSDLKGRFQKKADRIRDNMKLIATGQVQSLQNQTDILMRYSMKKRMLRNYSEDVLREFIDSLTRALDEKGYYVTRQFISEGQDTSF